MADPYLGEIKMFAGNFAPKNYALCNGQLLPLSQNTALFSLLGTYYGGDGRSTFGLPNLQGRAVMHWGKGNGLTQHTIGETGGELSVTLNNQEMPAHNHLMQCNQTGGDTNTPNGGTFSSGARGDANFYAGSSPFTAVPMAPNALELTGGSQPHNNVQPYLAVNFIIALAGIYPPRS